MNLSWIKNTNKYITHPLKETNIIAIYILLKPLYLFPSGLPQISDLILMLYVIYTIITKKGKLHISTEVMNVYLILCGLFLYQLFINLFWSAITNSNMYTNNLFYLFNILSFMLCCYLGDRFGMKRIKQSVIDGCFFSCILSLVGLYISDNGVRATSFFNNPNQLGYHGILLLSFVFLCTEKELGIKSIFIIIGSIWLIISSASKAALIGAFFLVVSYFIIGKESRGIKQKIFNILIVCLAFCVIYLLLYSDNRSISSNEQISFMRYRLFNMQAEDDSNLGAGRGYDRIGEMGINIIWGMGEGANERFSIMKGAEAHSTYASFLVSYGLIGILWFICFFASLIQDKRRLTIIKYLTVMSGLLLYGISHNGIRNTLLWLFFAVMLLNNKNENEITNKKQSVLNRTLV